MLATVRQEGITPEAIALFRELICLHYREYGRDLPWRRTTDPYRILVSELMLQQTQVDRVVPKYEAFIGRFPDFASLARAPLSDVLAAWQGLGYNRRAIALQKTAERVVHEFEGALPADVETLTTFPGIGPATAAAIAAYAFNLPVVYIETNIRRIFIHFFFEDREGVRDEELLPIIDQALLRDDPRTWYSALMDYGTVLSKRTVNPNRRSAAYTVQSRFEGSDRQLRGRVLALLLKEGALAEEEIVRHLGEDPGRVSRILGRLEAEGFLARDGGRITLCR
ncbi:endonuclease III [Methanoculleus taiwanensis]|uniref:Adenine DNA glycosylase n=1 Tax=Methanoculleus taiwanensis TaxID=1550565 RepID=A0A498H2A5_9EURY|nr:endonuclease III [Methanoculleus taiwanensis]